MNITERAAIVLQQIDAALALVKDAETWRVVANDDWTNVETPGRIVCHEVSRHDATFIAASRTSLRCLKTAIEGLLEISISSMSADENESCDHPIEASAALAALCDQWEESK
jgi:hypothetical protein